MEGLASNLYEGVTIDIAFDEPGPEFGDLFMICGYENPSFPPSGRFTFDEHADLGFSQIDDYFGIKSESGDGDDVVVWLSPLIEGESVYHDPGPFDAIRLQFNVLRNRPENVERFIQCVTALSTLTTNTLPSIDAIRSEIEMITQYWASEGIVPGSPEALKEDY